MESLKDKIVLITGATGGIGQHTVKLLVASGAQVFITGRDEQKLQALGQLYKIPASQICTTDLGNSGEVTELHEKFFAVFSHIDILVNAAGTGIIKPLEVLTEAEFMGTIQSNLLGPFLLLKNFLPDFKLRKKGLIINIPGILGKIPMAGAAAYSASKYGLVGMLQSVREEIKRTDIRMTNLFLGGVDSPFWDTIDLRVQREKMVQSEDAARAIWFLCQQPASGVVSEMVLQPFNHQAI